MRTAACSTAMALVVALCAAPSWASIEVGDHVKFTNGVGSPGGIFYVNDLTSPFAEPFPTFCVEITEFINFTATYGVENIGTKTVKGGKTLGSYTAWLYNSFLDNALNYFDPTKLSDVNALQLAIWLGMDYSAADVILHIGESWYNTYNTKLSTKTWAADFAADTDWSGIGQIRVMNLRKVVSGEYTDYAQDQLVRIHSPEPVSLLVWSLIGLCAGFAGMRPSRQ